MLNCAPKATTFPGGRGAGRAHGFSLLEVLVAFTLFSLAMAVLMQIFSRGVNSAALTDHYAKATMYAESKLASAGLEEALREGSNSGKFDDGFAWQVSIKPFQDLAPKDQQSLDFEKLFFNQLFEIESRVTFITDDNKERSVVLTTLQLGPRT